VASEAEGLSKAPNVFFYTPAAAPARSRIVQTGESDEASHLTSEQLHEQKHTSTAHRETDALVLRIQQHDREAFEQLFEKYCRLAFSVGNRVLRDAHEAEDLVQDVFLFLWSRSKLFVPGKRSAHDWIIRVIYHRAFDRRRYLITRLSYNHKPGDPRACNPALNTDRTGDLKDENLGELLYWHSYLESAFEQLSEAQRKTLTLFFYEGYTLVEISNELNESLENVRNHYYRGLRRLGRYVDGDDK
jgi:RNA polymerase sigma-70 factor (ECF subfamily)